MKCMIDIRWNGTLILSGSASAVMAHQNLQYMLAQFPNHEVREQYDSVAPTLVDLANAEGAQCWAGEFGDDTGRVMFTITT